MFTINLATTSRLRVRDGIRRQPHGVREVRPVLKALLTAGAVLQLWQANASRVSGGGRALQGDVRQLLSF